MNAWTYALYIAALLGAGLVGDTSFAFFSFVTKELSKIAPAEAIRAMQSINRVVITPGFLGAFTGTAPPQPRPDNCCHASRTLLHHGPEPILGATLINRKHYN